MKSLAASTAAFRASMLEADKSRWFEKLFAVYNGNLLKRKFNSLSISGLENLAARNKDAPLIIFGNHSSWWDGLIAFQISRAAHLDPYFMMEEKQLKNLSLFRQLGAFSVIRENPRKAIQSLNYAAKLLTNDSRRTLWIFPQGEILPNDVRPLFFYNGLARIAGKTGNCNLAAAAFRYEFLGNFKPDIFVKIEILPPTENAAETPTKTLTAECAEKLTSQIDSLKSDIIAGNLNDYQKLF